MAVLTAFGSLKDAVDQLEDHWIALLLTPWLLIASGPVVFTVLILCAPVVRRRAMRGALRAPLRHFAWFIGTLFLVPTLIVGLFVATPLEVNDSLEGWLTIPCLIAALWAVFLFLFASAAVARTGFGSAAVHPAARAAKPPSASVCSMSSAPRTGPRRRGEPVR
ncbi:hypothetical protein ABT314_03875 [Streptomyces spiralis]